MSEMDNIIKNSLDTALVLRTDCTTVVCVVATRTSRISVGRGVGSGVGSRV